MKARRNVSGRQIEQIRKEQGISRRQLCSKIRRNGDGEYTTADIRAIEAEERMVFDKDLWAISRALGVLPEDLLPLDRLLSFLRE